MAQRTTVVLHPFRIAKPVTHSFQAISSFVSNTQKGMETSLFLPFFFFYCCDRDARTTATSWDSRTSSSPWFKSDTKRHRLRQATPPAVLPPPPTPPKRHPKQQQQQLQVGDLISNATIIRTAVLDVRYKIIILPFKKKALISDFTPNSTAQQGGYTLGRVCMKYTCTDRPFFSTIKYTCTDRPFVSTFKYTCTDGPFFSTFLLSIRVLIGLFFRPRLPSGTAPAAPTSTRGARRVLRVAFFSDGDPFEPPCSGGDPVGFFVRCF